MKKVKRLKLLVKQAELLLLLNYGIQNTNKVMKKRIKEYEEEIREAFRNENDHNPIMNKYRWEGIKKRNPMFKNPPYNKYKSASNQNR